MDVESKIIHGYGLLAIKIHIRDGCMDVDPGSIIMHAYELLINKDGY